MRIALIILMFFGSIAEAKEPCKARSFLSTILSDDYQPIQLKHPEFFHYRISRSPTKKYGVSALDCFESMVKRQAENDDHLKQLNQWGIFFSETTPNHYSIDQILPKINQDIDQWIKEGKILPDEVLRPALEVRVGPRESLNSKTTYTHFTDLVTEYAHKDAVVMAEPGLFRSGVLDVKRWSHEMANGKMPFQAGTTDHDLAHFTDYTPEKMKAIRNFYRKVDQGEIPLIEFKVFQPSIDRVTTRKEAFPIQPGHRKLGQIMILDEWGSFPNLKSSQEIKKLVPELFQANSSVSIADYAQTLSQRLQKQPELIESHIANLYQSRDQILIRSGGAMRDSYNIVRAEVRFQQQFPWHEVARNGKYPKFKGEIVPSGYRDTLHCRIGVVKEVSETLKDQKKLLEISKRAKIPVKEVQKNLSQLLVDQTAQVDMALAQGVKLKLNPAQMIQDISTRHLDPKSMTYQYYSSFAEKGSFAEWSFLKP